MLYYYILYTIDLKYKLAYYTLRMPSCVEIYVVSEYTNTIFSIIK